MGDNITFVMNKGMPDGDLENGPFSILEPRLLFKAAASASEYGDGTPHPMKVTVEELFEIVYGVRDAWFTAGTAEFGYAGVGTYYTIAVTLIDPLEPLTAGAQDTGVDPPYDIYEWTYTRGYCVVSATPPPAFAENYLKAPYNTYTYIGVGFSDCYDIADREEGMWLFYDADAVFHFNGPGTSEGKLVTAFSHVNYYNTYTTSGIPYDTVYGIYALEDVYGVYPYFFTSVVFSREVKFVDNTGSGDPYDPGNDLYLGVRFSTDSEGLLYGAGWLDTNKTAIEEIYATYFDPPSEAYVTGLKFKMVLKASTVECALYAGLAEGPGESSSFEGGTDFVMTAKKWWPYQKKGGGDMYNTTTGADL